MKQENKKLIQNLKTKNLNLNKKLNTNWKYVKKKIKKIAWFQYGENYSLNFFKMDVIIYLFFTNLLIMFV